MNKKAITFSAILVTILICSLLASALHLKNNVDTSPAKNVESVDLATQNVISENLLIESNIQFSNKELNLNSYYFDGNRLYISVTPEKSKSSTDFNLNSFYINSKGDKKRADIIYNSKEFDIKVCNNFKDRLLGLMFKKNFNYGLCFPRCNSIHTFFMRQNIDVFMADKNNMINNTK